MIRLLEFESSESPSFDIQALKFEKASKVDAGINIAPGQERVTPGGPP
jgi:hypothetical protein